MATRTITATIRKSNGTPWAAAPVYFQLLTGGYTTDPPETVPAAIERALTDSAGALSVDLVAGLDAIWRATLPDHQTFEFTLPEGPAVTLETLRDAYRQGMQVVPWTPDLLSPLVWLKADAITGLADGAAVASWPDSSSQARHAANSVVGEQPTFETNELNGLPAVRFDGVNDKLFTASFAATLPFTIAMLVKDRAIQANGRYWADGTGTPTHRQVTNAPSYNGGTASRTFTEFSLLGLTWHIHLVNGNGNATNMRFDGTPSSTSTPDPGNADFAGGLRIGGAATTQMAALDVVELVMAAGALSTANAEKCEGYLAHRGALTASLPASHPYKTVPPVALVPL